MSEELKLCAMVLAKNAVALMCFTGLAIYFGKWWIVLFAGLFLTKIKKSGKKETSEDEDNA